MARKKKAKPELDLTLYTKSGTPRRRKPKQSRDYFTTDTEDAIIEYLASDDMFFRSQIYQKRIHESFLKLTENLIHTFKFYYTEVDSVEKLQHEVITFMLDKIHMYDYTKGRAYSYFGTVAKHWLIQYNNANYKKQKLHGNITEVDEDKKVYSDIVNSDNDEVLREFMDEYVKYVDTHINELFITKPEVEIAYAVLEIFKHRDSLDIFNKQIMYVHIREITNQPTPNITKVIKKLKETFKKCMIHDHLKGDLEQDTDDIDNYRLKVRH